MTTRTTRSPWLGIEPNVDPLKWAAILRRAHRLTLDRGATSAVLRPVVANSWRRATDCGVDPDGYAPVRLDSKSTRRALARHPISHLLREIQRNLREATDDSRYLVALSDADGLLLWVNGHPQALEVAGGAGFEPGHLCSEGAIGTNAVGTAIELRHPVQIFSAEHFSRRLHGLTCSAAPICDPETGRPIGVINLSGDFRTCHPHSLPLISSVSRLIEEALARELNERDNRLRGLLIDRLGASGGCCAVIARSGRVVASYPTGWLGPRVPLDADGELRFPPDLRLQVEPLKAAGGAAFVTPTSRHRPQAATTRIEALARSRVRIVRGDWDLELSPRHSEIVALLVAHPEGLSAEQLWRLYSPPRKMVTVRAEVSRLRKALGPALLSNPYRLEPSVRVDRDSFERVRGRTPALENGNGHGDPA